MDVNVSGLFHVNRAIAPRMVPKGYSRIINAASGVGKNGNPNASAYSASKSALIELTKSLAKKLARSGVCVTAITSAAVRTPIFEQMSHSHIDFMALRIPLGRFGRRPCGSDEPRCKNVRVSHTI